MHDAGLNSTCDEVVPVHLSSCEVADNNVDPTRSCPTWKVYAAFPSNSQPRLKSVSWGVNWSLSYFYIGGGISQGQGAVDVVYTPAWPDSGSGVTMTFHATQTTPLVDLLCFVGYTYYPEQLPGLIWSAAPHPTAPSVFLDDSVPPAEDPIAAYGTIGFGVPGYTPCPEPQPVPTVETSWGRLKAGYRR